MTLARRALRWAWRLLLLALLALLALQHAATVLALIAHVLAAAKMAGLSLPQTQSIVAMTLLGMAMGPALQAWGGRWGSRRTKGR